MKIAICTSPLSSASQTRGVGAYTRELLSALRSRYPNDEFLDIPGYPYRVQSDLVHYPFFDPYFLTLPSSFSRPTVITIHDLIPLKYPTHFPVGLRGRFKWYLQSRRARAAQAILTDSASSAADIHKLLRIPSDRVHVIPLASATARTTYTLNSKLSKQYSLPEQFILYVGDLNWNKNVPGLINAFARLKRNNIHLVLVGKVFSDRPHIPEFKGVESAIEQSGKSQLINLVGYVPRHHLGAIYHQATLYCQPSWDEGFGLPLLEAMKAGCPVLSSTAGSLPEVGGKAVAYFNPREPDSLVSELKYLLNNPDRRQELSLLGIARAKEFSWAKTAELTWAVYNQVLANLG